MRREGKGVIVETGYSDELPTRPYFKSDSENCNSGDSGSPAIVSVFGQPMVTGVLSVGGCNNDFPTDNYTAITGEVRDWLDAVMDSESLELGESFQLDADGDGLPDTDDTCPTIYDPSNSDNDGNGIGDLCETEAQAIFDSLTPTGSGMSSMGLVWPMSCRGSSVYNITYKNYATSIPQNEPCDIGGMYERPDMSAMELHSLRYRWCSCLDTQDVLPSADFVDPATCRRDYCSTRPIETPKNHKKRTGWFEPIYRAKRVPTPTLSAYKRDRTDRDVAWVFPDEALNAPVCSFMTFHFDISRIRRITPDIVRDPEIEMGPIFTAYEIIAGFGGGLEEYLYQKQLGGNALTEGLIIQQYNSRTDMFELPHYNVFSPESEQMEGSGIAFAGFKAPGSPPESEDYVFFAYGGRYAGQMFEGGLWIGTLQAATNEIFGVGPHYPEQRPEPRSNSAMFIKDESNGEILIYGGQSYGGHLGDLWSFSLYGNVWNAVQPSGEVPSGRSHVAIVQSLSTQTAYLFGGITDAGVDGELYRFDLQTLEFEKITAGFSPSARHSASLAYDALRNRLYLFGGVNEGAILNDLWVYDIDLGEWEKLEGTCATSACPSLVNSSVLTYDRYSRRLRVLLGDSDWEYNEPVWTFEEGGGWTTSTQLFEHFGL